MEKTKSELSQERANRLKCLREMSGLSRDAIKDRYNISRGTLQNWESARFGGLTAKGATQFIRAMQAEGIVASHDWLFHGIGVSPSMVPKNGQKIQKQHSDKTPKPQAIQELVKFKANNTDAIDLIATDQSMWPIVHQDDMVAGIRVYREATNDLIEKVAIVQTHEHGTLIRKILPGEMANTYHLSVLNLEACQNITPILYNISILSAAEVIWIRVGNRQPLITSETIQAHTETHESYDPA